MSGDELKLATVMARCTTAMIRALGMQATNMQRDHRGESMAYTSEDFEKVIEDEGTHWNAIHDVLFR